MVDITDWYDLDDIRNDTQGSYILQNDLDQDTAGYDEIAGPNANSGKGFKPIGDGSNGNQFEGTLDGNGKEIRDLKINRPNENKVGLIKDHNGTLKNLLVVNANIEGQDQVALTGNATNTNDFGGGSIKKVGIDGTSSFVGESEVASITGITAPRTYITQCYSLATVEATKGDGAGLTPYLAGRFSVRMEFNYNYYAGDITASDTAYPLADGTGLSSGSNNYWDKEKTGITNNYGVGATGLTTSEMTGSNAPNNMTALDFSTGGNWKVVTNTYPDLKSLERKKTSVTTLQAENTDSQGFLAKGEVTEIATSNLEVGFDYRQVGDSNFDRVIVDTISSPQQYSYEFNTLLTEEEYEYKAVAFNV